MSTSWLKKRAEFAKKKQKGLGAFVKLDAGDVEKGNAMFNNAMGSNTSESSCALENMGDSLSKATPYMLRNDGRLIDCSPMHPYIKFIYEDISATISKLSTNRFSSLQWFYNNTKEEKIRENIRIVINYLIHKTLLEENIKDDFYITNDTYLCSDEEIEDFINELNADTNQEFLRVRTSSLLFGGDNNDIYFRISSVRFNWFDLIFNLISKYSNNIATITIVKDTNTFGGRFDPYIIDGKEIKRLSINEFMELKGNPIVESLSSLDIINEAVKKLMTKSIVSEAFANLHPRYAYGFYTKAIKEFLDDDIHCILNKSNEVKMEDKTQPKNVNIRQELNRLDNEDYRDLLNIYDSYGMELKSENKDELIRALSDGDENKVEKILYNLQSFVDSGEEVFKIDLTPSYTDPLKIAKDLAKYLADKKLEQDVSIYVGGKRYKVSEDGKLKYDIDADPRDYFNFVRTPNILSMSFEGPLYDAINYDDIDTLQPFFDKYGLYYELGNAWNLSVYPIDNDFEWDKHLYDNNDTSNGDLKEEYGYYKDEPYMEEIANRLEGGIWASITNNGTPWELTIMGMSRDEFSSSFADYLAEEISYPVKDGHLSYQGLDFILNKNALPPHNADADELEKYIPDLIKLGFDRNDIDNWLKDDADAELETSIYYDIDFNVDDYRRNNEEDVDLPDSVTYDFYTLVDDGIDINSDDYNLDEVIADSLSDDYGYLHNGFEYNIDKESGDVYVYDIKWDLSESYTHFEFEEGNPYIATTEEEKERLLKKYNNNVKEIKPGFYKVFNKKEDSSILKENVNKLLTNQEFINEYKKTDTRNFDGLDIVLDWDNEQHTFEDWEEKLFNTYLDLEQDLLAQGNYDTVKHNRDLFINKYIGQEESSKNNNLVESIDWKGSVQETTKEYYWNMLEAMPPLEPAHPVEGYTNQFLMGEPYTENDNGKPLYGLFGKKDDKYYYLGLDTSVK